MSLAFSQRELIVNFRKETCYNVSILSKIFSMPGDLARQIFKGDALEKPTQNTFLNLTYYLARIVDPQKAGLLTWPLYDTKAERNYRNEFANFVLEYSKLNLISPVMSSYFVNPGCYKVVKLLFQLSQLAVERALKSKMVRKEQLQLFEDVSKKYQSGNNEDFMQNMDKEVKVIISNFSLYQKKKQLLEETAVLMQKKIVENEDKIKAIEKKKVLQNLLDGFIAKYAIDQKTAKDIQSIKNVGKTAKIFDTWLEEIDKDITSMENKWDSITPVIKLAKNCHNLSETVLANHMGKSVKDTYMIEFNPNTVIPTKDLEEDVTNQQVHILKNIITNERLNFPNLIRGFVIATCYVLKETNEADDVSELNVCMENRQTDYAEISMALRSLHSRISDVEAELVAPSPSFHSSISIKDLPTLPPLPDLTNIKTIKQLLPNQTLKPIPTGSQFNMNDFRKTSALGTVSPFYTPLEGPKDDFRRTIKLCMTSKKSDASFSQPKRRANETIAACTSGFTKGQIQKLLSTRKQSLRKNNINPFHSINSNAKKGGLFNDSKLNESLQRCHSSPNFYENRTFGRQTSIPECPALLEVSGISAIDMNSESFTPKLTQTGGTPTEQIKKLNVILKETEDLEEPIIEKSVLKEISNVNLSETTPKTINPIKKTGSIEKIINRFKKVRATLYTEDTKDMTIAEDKEKSFNEVFSSHRRLLPDLLSPSLKQNELDFDDEIPSRKPRESLGTALGVDNTFLDQFDISD